MPATAGRVRMPANNRVHSSAALQTHGIWQSAIGYDPYAPTKDKDAAKASDDQAAPGDAENAYASFQGLLALARITGSSSNETRGACKRCGRVGHLTFQCRNFLSIKDDKEKDGDATTSIQTANAMFEKIKKASKKDGGESVLDEDDESEESESSDSDVDPEMERIIAARFGKKVKKKTTIEEDSMRRGRSKKRSTRGDDESEYEEEERRKEKRKKRHRTSDDDEDDRKLKHRKSRKDRKRRSHKKREDSDESDEESDRHRRHRRKRRDRKRDASASESDSDNESAGDRKRSHRSERRRRRRAASDSRSESDGSDKEDSRVRKEKMRTEKKSRGHRRE